MPIGVYVQPKKGTFTLQHVFHPVSRRNDLTEPIRVLFSNAYYDALVCFQKVQHGREIMGVMEKPIREVEITTEIKLEEQHEEDIRSMLEMLVSKTEGAETEEHWATCLDMLVEEAIGEIILDEVLHEINKAHEEIWTTVKPRKGKAQKERTGLITDNSSEMYQGDTYIAQQREVMCMSTGLIIEKGSEIDDNRMEIEDADTICSLSPDVQPGHDTMGRIIIEDGA